MTYKNSIDYNNLDILVALEYYQVKNLSYSKKKFSICCPIHNGNDYNFSVDTEKNLYNCFSRCNGGNVVSLIQKMENIEKSNWKDTNEMIRKIYDLDTTSHHQPAEQRSKREIAPPPPQIINTDNHIVYNDVLAYCATIPNKAALDYLTKQRCLNREMLHKANIQTFETSKLQSYLKQKYSYADLQKFGLSINLTNYQIVIPYYHNNKIANLQFRSLCPNDDTKKYKFLYDKPRF